MLKIVTDTDNASQFAKPAKQIRRKLSGVLLLDKPAGLSSTNVLGRARWLLQAEKAGHTGTLDPFATGLLPLCFGEATKFSRFMLDAEKTYTATLKLGCRTPTGDTESAPMEQREIRTDEASICRVLANFLGARTQVPPMYSAIKREGVPLYKLARRGIEVERCARPINVYSLDMLAFNGGEIIINTKVSKGTYIRVLAEDIGEALGCGAHLTQLRRTATAGYSIDDAITLDALEKATLVACDQQLKSVDTLAFSLPSIALNAAPSLGFAHGQVVEITPHSAGEYRVYSADGRFLGIGEVRAIPSREDISLAEQPAQLTPIRLMTN